MGGKAAQSPRATGTGMGRKANPPQQGSATSRASPSFPSFGDGTVDVDESASTKTNAKPPDRFPGFEAGKKKGQAGKLPGQTPFKKAGTCPDGTASTGKKKQQVSATAARAEPSPPAAAAGGC